MDTSDRKGEPPPNWWTPLLSSEGSGGVEWSRAVVNLRMSSSGRRLPCWRLLRYPDSRRHHPIDEPQGKLLGQCADGEFLRHPENRTRSPARIPRSGCRATRLFAYIEGYYNRQRIHSAIGYIHPRTGRGDIRLTRCPLFRGKVSQAPPAALDEIVGTNGHQRAHNGVARHHVAR
jgi:hypothetical protein